MDTSSKGEESAIVVFWKVEDAKQSTEDLDNEETDGKARRRFPLRYYRVWELGTMRASARRARQEIEVPSFSWTDPTRVN